MVSVLADRYSDLSFNPKLNNEGDISQVYDIASINQSLFNILHTVKGSRPMLPTFGCNVSTFLFEPFDDDTSNKIKREINYAFSNFEPRIRILELNVDQDVDNYRYNIEVKYMIEKLQTIASFTADLQKL